MYSGVRPGELTAKCSTPPRLSTAPRKPLRGLTVEGYNATSDAEQAASISLTASVEGVQRGGGRPLIE